MPVHHQRAEQDPDLLGRAELSWGVPTTVYLNSIMVDGTGMCAVCRAEVGSQPRFACVDGPEFDGHQVNWDLLLARQRIYLEKKKPAAENRSRGGNR
jgi:ferredoxin--NADP+ reductase